MTSRLRSRTSTTIRRYQRPHQILVGQSQSPNTKTATQEPEPTSGSKLPGHVRDDKPPGGDREYHGIGEREFDRRKRYREIKTFFSELPELPIHSEPGNNSKLPGTSKDDKSPGGDREQPGTGKMSQDPESPELPESEYHFDFRPDTSS